MVKKHEEEVKIEPGRPELENKQVSPEVLSHNWQPGSPAIDLRYPGSDVNAVNFAERDAAAKEEKKAPEHKIEQVSQAEYDRRVNLDSSDPKYINPSLDHVKVK